MAPKGQGRALASANAVLARKKRAVEQQAKVMSKESKKVKLEKDSEDEEKARTKVRKGKGAQSSKEVQDLLKEQADAHGMTVKALREKFRRSYKRDPGTTEESVDLVPRSVK